MSSRFRELHRELLEEHEREISELRRKTTNGFEIGNDSSIEDTQVSVCDLNRMDLPLIEHGSEEISSHGENSPKTGSGSPTLPGKVESPNEAGDQLRKTAAPDENGKPEGDETDASDSEGDDVTGDEMSRRRSDMKSAFGSESSVTKRELPNEIVSSARKSCIDRSKSMSSVGSSVTNPVMEINEAWLQPATSHSSRNKRSGSGSDPSIQQDLSPVFSSKRTVVSPALQHKRPERQHDHWLLQRLISSPSSPRRLCWDVLGLLFMAYDMVMVPMQCFDLQFDEFLEIANITTCTFWSVDVLLSFFVGYYGTYKVEMRFHLIAIHYIKSWLAMDLALVAMDWIFFLAGGFSTNARLVRLGKIARGMRVFRLLRMLKFHAIFEDLLDRIHSEYHRTLLGILKLMLLIVAINHFIACIWYGLHNLREGDTWVKAFFTDKDGLGYRYWTSMHWSLTQFTPASMEVVPTNSLERFYAVCTLLLAMVTFSSFVSTITNSMTHLRKLNSEEASMYTKLHKFFSEHNVSDELVHTILRYLKGHKNNLQKSRSISMPEQEVVLLKLIPEELKTELRFEVHMPTIRIHPLLYNYELVDPHALQHLVRAALCEKMMHPGEEHLAHNQEIKHMIIMRKGQLDYVYPTRNTPVTAKIVTNEWVCEAALWAKSPEAFGPMVAKAPCALLLIEASKFISVVKRYETSFKYVKRYAKLFVELLNEEIQDCPWVGILCNNFDSIRDVVQRAFDEASHHDALKTGASLTRGFTSRQLSLGSSKKGLRLWS